MKNCWWIVVSLLVVLGKLGHYKVSAVSPCRTKMTSWQGTFRSPGYKSGYPADLDCHWLISVDQGNIIEIKFKEFSVHESSSCLQDYVQIHDGPTIASNSSLTPRLCGSSLTQTVFTSRGHVVLVVMRTDNTGSSPGFEASHRGLCHVNITSPHGVIRSPGYPSPYQGPMRCSWLIDRGPGYFTTISVDRFTLNNQTNCESNNVKIYEVQKANVAVLTICRGVNLTNITTRGPVRISMMLDGRNVTASLQATFNTTDVDECSNETLNAFPCIKTAKCHNNDGSFTCTCNTGYQGDGQRCSDIDECLTNKHKCHRNTTVCINTAGSYRCPCNKGYTGTENNCTDIDECTLPRHNCHVNAECANLNGSFTCRCNNGYRGSGVRCNDVNECLERTHSCRVGAICINKQGSYTCPCRDGFDYDRQTSRCLSDALTLEPPTETQKQLSTMDIIGIVLGIIVLFMLAGIGGLYYFKKRKESHSSYGASEGEDVAYYHGDQTVSHDYEFRNLSFHGMDSNPPKIRITDSGYGNYQQYDIDGQIPYAGNHSHRRETNLDQMESIEV